MMLFYHDDDVRDCLAVLREYLEDPRPLGRELAEERLAELAEQIKKELELAEEIPPSSLETMSDFLHERHAHLSCDWTVALLDGLVALEKVRQDLTCMSAEDAVEILRPAFLEILSQQAQAGAQAHMANQEAMQKARRKGGKASLAVDLDGLLRGIVSRFQRVRVKDVWERFSANSAVFTRPDGSKITVAVEAREPEDKFVIRDLNTGEELYAGTFKALTGHMTKARTWSKEQEARKIPRK